MKHAVLKLSDGTEINPYLFKTRCSSIANVARALAIAIEAGESCGPYDVPNFSAGETCLSIVALLDSLQRDIDAYLEPDVYGGLYRKRKANSSDAPVALAVDNTREVGAAS